MEGEDKDNCPSMDVGEDSHPIIVVGKGSRSRDFNHVYVFETETGKVISHTALEFHPRYLVSREFLTDLYFARHENRTVLICTDNLLKIPREVRETVGAEDTMELDLDKLELI